MKFKRIMKIPLTILSIVILIHAFHSAAYAPVPYKWPTGTANFDIGELGRYPESRDGIVEAIARWHDTKVAIKISTNNQLVTGGCGANGRNSIYFADNSCGTFDRFANAVTTIYFTNDVITEVDIRFDVSLQWDINDSIPDLGKDFVRVAVHELGHAFGAMHVSSPDAIMYGGGVASANTIVPELDDLNALAVGARYGWEATNRNVTLEAIGNGYVEVSPRVRGTRWMSADNRFASNDFSSLWCYGRCTHSLQDGLRLNLRAVPKSGATFLGWSSPTCASSSSNCVLQPLGAATLVHTARFSGAPPAVAIPASPQGVTASKGTYSDRIEVRWGAVAGATEYRVWVADSPTGRKYEIAGIVYSPGTSKILKDWQRDETFYFFVTACNAQGCSSYSGYDTGYQAGGKANIPLHANEEQVLTIGRLYTAAFNRLPDDSGMRFWVDKFENGTTLLQIASKFVVSPEFSNRYGNLGNESFVKKLYRNVLGRDGERSGINFWTTKLQQGISRAKVLERFSASPENIARTRGWTAVRSAGGSGGWKIRDSSGGSAISPKLQIKCPCFALFENNSASFAVTVKNIYYPKASTIRISVWANLADTQNWYKMFAIDHPPGLQLNSEFTEFHSHSIPFTVPPDGIYRFALFVHHWNGTAWILEGVVGLEDGFFWPGAGALLSYGSPFDNGSTVPLLYFDGTPP